MNGQYWADLLSQKLGYTVTPGEPYYTAGCTTVERSASCPMRDPRDAPGPRLRRRFCRTFPRRIRATTSSRPRPNNQTLRDDKGALRIDANTRWGALSAYYFSDDYSLDNPYPTAQGGANVPGFNALSLGRAQLASVGLTTTFGPAAINELRFGIHAYRQRRRPAGRAASARRWLRRASWIARGNPGS